MQVGSVEIYNRTGKIQREEFSGYNIVYAYDDSGRLTSVKKDGGGIGSNAPVETYLYSGGVCTQRVIYDASGNTQQTYYWTYDKKGNMTKERVVSLIPSVSGHGYSGKSEENTLFSEDGLKESYTFTSGDEYTKNEYGYDGNGNLVTDNSYRSSDGKDFRFSGATTYWYDEAGKLLRESRSDVTGDVYYLRVYELDEAGRPVTDTAYSSADRSEENRIFQYRFEYDEDGRLSFKAYYCGDDTVQTFYEYDEKGNCVSVSEKKYSSGSSGKTTVTYTEYDEHSNAVRETVKDPDETERISFVCSYEYYEDGKIRKKTNYIP